MRHGTFAYVHLLSRLAIVAAVVALFHLDDIRNVMARWSDVDGRRVLLGLAATLTVLVGGWAWHRSRPDRPRHLVEE